ncbi:Holliday junction branch migration protein RuvA [Anaplasmataceae bacterium AB001_6]|nr:Holliday junction branch migration protein RuvA [Anaplasmataceae bacterium AB001_6]
MIGKISGIITEIYKEYVLLTVHDISYVIYLPKNIMQKVKIGERHQFYITHHFYEGGQKLYGLIEKSEQVLLEKLATVSGISYKIALNLLGNLTSEEIITAIKNSDENVLKIPGIGNKIAKRLITELKDFCLQMQGHIQSVSIAKDETLSSIKDEAISALLNLGYKSKEAELIVQKTMNNLNKETKVDEIVKESLRNLLHAKS